LSDSISTKPTSAPIAFSAITISLFSAVGYSQSEVNEITKNLEVVLLKAADRLQLNCFDSSLLVQAVPFLVPVQSSIATALHQ